MNEVEKMHENAGIKPYIYCSKPRPDCDARETGNCKQDCEYYSGERSLTPFTAEKQLDVLRALVFNNKAMSITQYYPHKQFCINNDMFIGIGEDFGEALAMFVNKLWQHLTEEEHTQIKNILECSSNAYRTKN